MIKQHFFWFGKLSSTKNQLVKEHEKKRAKEINFEKRLIICLQMPQDVIFCENAF